MDCVGLKSDEFEVIRDRTSTNFFRGFMRISRFVRRGRRIKRIKNTNTYMYMHEHAGSNEAEYMYCDCKLETVTTRGDSDLLQSED
jgi:hypothetical protein